MASSSSSFSVTSPCLYDVFLSFRGEDIRDTFIAHLHHALMEKGIFTFIYEDEVKRGDEISPELLYAIERSRISIIVLSANYASSTWCLDELLKILEWKKLRQRQLDLPVFYRVNPSDIRHQRKSFGEALTNGDMKLQMWKAALRDVANLSGDHLTNGNEAIFIEGIVQDISRFIESDSYLPVAKYPTGLDSQLRDIMNLHLSLGTNGVRMVGILGLGGIGKTSLAKAIWNSIAFRFEASCFLANVSDHSNRGRGLVRLQETLYSKIFRGRSSLEIDSIDSGINKIKRILHSKRVLLILDGVDHITQLDALAGACDWFGEGSRIIITTRDQHLLTAHGVDSTYKMKSLNYHDACQLFCWHAFKKQKPVEGYDKFVEQIISYAGSLPLALTVLGSDLYRRSESEWKSSLDKYKQIPHQDIQNILQTSYDRLSVEEKNLFLDIDGRLQMHDLLRDMGRKIVRRESPNNPGARSGLFFHDHVQEVPEADTGIIRIEAIVIDFPEGDDFIHLSPKAFKNMRRLRLFRCLNAHFSEELPDRLPNKISILDWPNCHLQSMPPQFRGDKLFILGLPGSHIQEISLFKNLTVMNFRGCGRITELSDVSRCPNLKKINLRDCTSLVKIHDSVGLLDKLVKLNLAGCSNLWSFPRRLQLRSLGFLDLSNCSSLQYFPEIECEMKHLGHVDLTGTAIEELPSSIGKITGLGFLDLSSCVKVSTK